MKDDFVGYINHIPYDADLKELARKNRKNPTKAEQKMWDEVLRNKQLDGFKFHRQKPIDNYIADFFCPKLKLAIEIDGGYHLEEDTKKYDEDRTMAFEEYGITVIRYSNKQILQNIDKVKTDLLEKIKNKIESKQAPC